MEKDFTADVIKEAPSELIKAPKKGFSNFLSHYKGPKIIFLLLGIIVAVELVIAGINIFVSNQGKYNNPAPSVNPVTEAKISLVSKEAVSVGEKFPLQVRVFTGGKPADGVDVILKYDPNAIEVNRDDITTGGIFSDYPLIDVSQRGLIKISAIDVSGRSSFNGLGVLATINFSAKKEGPTSVTVEFTKDSTTDSNVIEVKKASDMLGGVENASFTVGSTTSIGGSSCTNRVQYRCIDSEEKVGIYWCTGVNDGLNCGVGCFNSKEGTEAGCRVVTVTQ